MANKKLNIKVLIPKIPKRYLLFVAGFVWTFAGSMLFIRGFAMMIHFPELFLLKIISIFVVGFIFYFLLFSKIALKHIQRILKMENQKPCIFSFFNFRSYSMMALMIGMGIVLRKTEIVPIEYLSMLYLTMGVPLSLSAFRFFYNGIYYKKATENVSNKKM